MLTLAHSAHASLRRIIAHARPTLRALVPENDEIGDDEHCHAIAKIGGVRRRQFGSAHIVARPVVDLADESRAPRENQRR